MLRHAQVGHQPARGAHGLRVDARGLEVGAQAMPGRGNLGHRPQAQLREIGKPEVRWVCRVATAQQEKRIACHHVAKAHQRAAVGRRAVVVFQHAHGAAPGRVGAPAFDIVYGAARRAGRKPLDLDAFTGGKIKGAQRVKRRIKNGAEIFSYFNFHGQDAAPRFANRSEFHTGDGSDHGARVALRPAAARGMSQKCIDDMVEILRRLQVHGVAAIGQHRQRRRRNDLLE